MIINMIQESCIHFFLTNYSVNYIKVWNIDQNFKLLEIEYKININLIVN